MQLYYSETMNPRKACATAKQVGADVEYVRVDLAKGGHKSADFMGLNPNGRVPLLVDGGVRLWESAAICAYIAGRAESDMWPSHDYRAQAEILRWISWGSLHWARAVGPFYFELSVKPYIGLGAPDERKLEAATPEVHVVAGVLDAMLTDRTYLCGDQLTIADFIVAAALPGWQELRMPLHDYANIRRWHDERLMSLPAWAEPWPKGSPLYGKA